MTWEENAWYLEYWDVNLGDWAGVPPYTEHLSPESARKAYADHKATTPGGRARVVHEVRRVDVVYGG